MGACWRIGGWLVVYLDLFCGEGYKNEFLMENLKYATAKFRFFFLGYNSHTVKCLALKCTVCVQ